MKIEEAINQAEFASMTQKSTINMMYTASWLSSEMQHALKEFGISSQQFNIMRILRGQGDCAVSLKLVSGRMIDQMSNTSRLVDKLVTKGFVKRETSACDRRQLAITLTDEGRTHLDATSRRVEDISNALFNHMSADKMETLNDILDELRKKEI